MPISVLVTADGDPQVPEDVNRRLAGIGVRLDWQRQMRQWAVKRPWPESDRRWQWIQEQQYSPDSAHDILGYVPNDCSVEQVPAYLERMLREWPHPDRDAMLSRLVHYNESGTSGVQAAVEEAIAETVEEVTAPLKRKPGRPRKNPE